MGLLAPDNNTLPNHDSTNLCELCLPGCMGQAPTGIQPPVRRCLHCATLLLTPNNTNNHSTDLCELCVPNHMGQAPTGIQPPVRRRLHCPAMLLAPNDNTSCRPLLNISTSWTLSLYHPWPCRHCQALRCEGGRHQVRQR